MPFFNVEVTISTTMVVEAPNADEAYWVAKDNARQAFDDERPEPEIDVRGAVTSEECLRDGWDGDCLPYGGDGNTRLRELLVPNA